jgi:hypothetical protein
MNTHDRVVEFCHEAADIVREKNNQRQDAWKDVGAVGAFMDIHKNFSRIQGVIFHGQKATLEELKSYAHDLHNYTALFIQAMEDENLFPGFDGGEGPGLFEGMLEKSTILDQDRYVEQGLPDRPRMPSHLEGDDPHGSKELLNRPRD